VRTADGICPRATAILIGVVPVAVYYDDAFIRSINSAQARAINCIELVLKSGLLLNRAEIDLFQAGFAPKLKKLTISHCPRDDRDPSSSAIPEILPNCPDLNVLGRILGHRAK
jgi:hypothetical protein